jgi:RND family efflux transporter MFP subunit
MPRHRPSAAARHRWRPGLLVLGCAAAAAAACRNASSGAGQGPPAVAVRIQGARAVPVEDATEYLATLKSRDSAVIMPEVEGQVTEIFVRSGERVDGGAPLLQIDPARQQATVKSQQDTRAAKQAGLELARQEFERVEALHAEGILSLQDLDRARSALDAAHAELAALDAQLDERRVELRYHRVTAPTAGIVGDVPVRVGDRVTVSTVLTTLSRASGLEAYVSVPVERAPGLRPGLPLRLLDGAGEVTAETRVSFVAPHVDDATQTVLVKAWVPGQARLRPAQLVRARIVWGAAERLVVPVLAVSRLGGQHFAFVAEQAKDALVARQKLVRVGEIVGNDYVVLEGLAPGERVIVSGTQMLADGVPVRPLG